MALSSAKAAYNQACLAIMATTHANMILENLIQQDTQNHILIMDSKSGIAIGSSFKGTKLTSHILHCYQYVRNAFNNNNFKHMSTLQEFGLADISMKRKTQRLF